MRLMLFFPGKGGWETVRVVEDVRAFEAEDGRLVSIELTDGTSPDVDLSRVVRWQELSPRGL